MLLYCKPVQHFIEVAASNVVEASVNTFPPPQKQLLTRSDMLEE